MPISAKSWVGRSYHRRLVVVDIQQTGAGLSLGFCHY